MEMNLGVNTPEIEKDLNKLFSSILAEQQKIHAIKSPTTGQEHVVTEALDEYIKHRGQNIFYPYLSTGRGHGPFTEIVGGAIKYDLIGGIGPNLLGHSHPLYIKAHLEAATKDSVMCGNLQPYTEASLLTRDLLKAVEGSRLKHFWFAGSGSFAGDTALKVIWQKKSPKSKMIAFQGAFAGRSIGTQEITSNPDYRSGMPKLLDVIHIPYFDENDPDMAINKTLEALDTIWREDSKKLCAMSVELIQGEGGFVHGSPEYYRAIFDWVKKRDLYLWIDEVQTFGRTHELFAFQHFGLQEYPDVVTVGKVLQACGTFYTEELSPRPGLIAGTFNGSLVELNAGRKILHYLQEGNFYGPEGKIKAIEEDFKSRLRFIKKDSCKGKIGNIGGVGTMIYFEVGDSTKETTVKFIKKLFDNGVIAFMCGKSPVRVRMLLPLCLADEHVDEIIRIIRDTVLEVI